jgi:hypothetical protein
MREQYEISQYEQCHEDWRHFDNAIWQMPSIAIAVASGLLAISYEFVEDLLPRAVILFFGFLICSSLTVALIKHRLFLDERTKILKKIEKNWRINNSNVKKIKRKTREISVKHCYQKISAYRCLLLVITITSLTLFGLAILNILLFIGIKTSLL